MIPTVRLLAVLLVPALLLAGCGTDAKDEPEKKVVPSLSVPTSHVTVPTGVTLTTPGTDLRFGQTATVAYEPNAKRSTVLQVNVTRVVLGSIADLQAYALDDRTKQSTPYYVSVTLKNVGTGDVGRTPIPVWAVDQTNTLIQSSSFTNSFTRCPSGPLPTTFAPQASATACLVYLVPNHGKLTAMSFRPVQALEPITWKGNVTNPATKPKKKPKKS